MADARPQTAASAGEAPSAADWIYAPLESTLGALSVPVALLDKSAAILTVNAAWIASRSLLDGTSAACRPGGDWRDCCRTMPEELSPAILVQGVSDVLAGVRKNYEHTRRLPWDGAARGVRICIARLERQAQPLFLLSWEEFTETSEPQTVEERVLGAQAEERERLAAELHDSVGQNLVCLGLDLTRLRRVLPPDSEFAPILADMAESLQHAHAEIRTLSYLLHPPWPEEPGAFEKMVREFVGGFARRAGLRARVRIKALPQAIGRERELTLFRILQEALVNVHRHAQAQHVGVEFAQRGKHLVLKVEDNGHGIAAPEGVPPVLGVGMLGMRARARQFGGDLRIDSSPHGTLVTARLPV